MPEITEAQLRRIENAAEQLDLGLGSKKMWASVIRNVAEEIKSASTESESAEARQTSPED